MLIVTTWTAACHRLSCSTAGSLLIPCICPPSINNTGDNDDRLWSSREGVFLYRSCRGCQSDKHPRARRHRASAICCLGKRVFVRSGEERKTRGYQDSHNNHYKVYLDRCRLQPRAQQEETMVQAKSPERLTEAAGAKREGCVQGIQCKLLQRADIPMDGPNHEGSRPYFGLMRLD